MLFAEAIKFFWFDKLMAVPLSTLFELLVLIVGSSNDLNCDPLFESLTMFSFVGITGSDDLALLSSNITVNN